MMYSLLWLKVDVRVAIIRKPFRVKASAAKDAHCPAPAKDATIIEHKVYALQCTHPSRSG